MSGPMLLVFNKIGWVDSKTWMIIATEEFPQSVFISAMPLPKLTAHIAKHLKFASQVGCAIAYPTWLITFQNENLGMMSFYN